MSSQSNNSSADNNALPSQALDGNNSGFTLPATNVNGYGFTTGAGSAQQLPATLGGLAAPDYTTAAMTGNSNGILTGSNVPSNLANALGKASVGSNMKVPTLNNQMPTARVGGGVPHLQAQQFSSGIIGSPTVGGSQAGMSLLQLMQQLRA